MTKPLSFSWSSGRNLASFSSISLARILSIKSLSRGEPRISASLVSILERRSLSNHLRYSSSLKLSSLSLACLNTLSISSLLKARIFFLSPLLVLINFLCLSPSPSCVAFFMSSSLTLSASCLAFLIISSLSLSASCLVFSTSWKTFSLIFFTISSKAIYVPVSRCSPHPIPKGRINIQ